MVAFDLSARLYVTSYAKILLSETLGSADDAGGGDEKFRSAALRFQLAF